MACRHLLSSSQGFLAETGAAPALRGKEQRSDARDALTAPLLSDRSASVTAAADDFHETVGERIIALAATNRVLAVADGGRPLAGEGGHGPTRRSGDPRCPTAVAVASCSRVEIVTAPHQRDHAVGADLVAVFRAF